MSRLAFDPTAGEGFAAGMLADASLAPDGEGLTLTGIASGGIVYVITKPEVGLPPSQGNW